jgi:hypothetical protein
MANLIITYWRDIPSAISVKAGRKRKSAYWPSASRPMTTAMRGDATIPFYLADWRRAEPISWATIC